MPFAERVAKRMTLHQGERADVRADALFGLVTAAGRGRHGLPFAPYAQACIEGQIRRGKRDRSGIRADRKVPRPLSVSLESLYGDVEPALELMGGVGAVSPYQAAEHAELWRLVDALAPRQAQAVRLYYQWDLSQQTIADMLGVSQMEVSRILIKARASLKASVWSSD